MISIILITIVMAVDVENDDRGYVRFDRARYQYGKSENPNLKLSYMIIYDGARSRVVHPRIE